MRRAVLVLLAIALIAGCERSPSGAEDNTARMNPTVPPQKELPSNRAGGATTPEVRVDLNEYEIRMPETLPAGPASFLIVNSGKENHSFVIEGNGVRVGLSDQLTRGDSQPLHVELKKGTYTVYCPVDEHRGKGMSRTISVQ